MGWQRSEIYATPTDEVFAHIIHARRAESNNRLWQLSAAVQPNRTAEDQQRAFEDARAIGNTTRQRRSPYDIVPTRERIVMIGGDLEMYGDEWARAHPKQMQWLASQGISREEAIRRNQAWIAERMGDGG